MKPTFLLVIWLSATLAVAQSDPGLLLWVEDHTNDEKINDLDIIYLYVPGIDNTIQREEWDRKNIDLSINDISLDKITPRRIPKTLPLSDGDSIRNDVLAFVVRKESFTRPELDALRNLEKMDQVYVSLKLPDDAVLSKIVEVRDVSGSKALQWASYIAVGLFGIFLIWVGFWKGALKDISNAAIRPYSFSRSQIWWWTLIVLTSWVYIVISSSDYSLNATALVLIGISGSTLAAGYAIDKKDEQSVINASANASSAQTPAKQPRHQDDDGSNWFNDVLTDQTGNISIHRIQVFLFNLTFGVYFLVEVYTTLQIPTFDESVLGLLGLSNGVYTAVKFNENN